MTHRTRSILNIITLCLLGLLGLRFFYLIFYHQILYYINTRLLWFIVLGWATLIVVVLVTLIHGRKDHAHVHTRLHTFIYVYSLIVFLLLLPVQALNPEHSLVVRLQQTDMQPTDKILPADTSPYTFSDWFNYLSSGSPKPELKGKTFNTSGFLASYDAQQKTLELGRLVITCCIADAYQTKITINLGNISTTGLISDKWYAVVGHWQQNSDEEWVVQADSIMATSTPEDPYVFP